MLSLFQFLGRGKRSIPEPPKAPSPSEPAPVVAHRLDFTALGLPEYKSRYALVIDNAFTQEDCQRLVSAAEASAEWEVAQINGGPNFAYTDTSYRNSSRIMLDDTDLAMWMLEKIRPYLGDIEHIEGTRHKSYAEPSMPQVRLTRLNERLRFLRYGEGQFFKPHVDASYGTPDKKEISYYTLQVYLDGSSDALKGGATRFWQRKVQKPAFVDVEPRMGRVLVFEQAGLLHSGEPVLRGIKTSMRTDFMYELEEGELTVPQAS